LLLLLNSKNGSIDQRIIHWEYSNTCMTDTGLCRAANYDADYLVKHRKFYEEENIPMLLASIVFGIIMYEIISRIVSCNHIMM
jgi:hypothetical protein